ncbi:recombinase RecT [Paenibacillus sp. LjRoot153]|uniref:recombinase RecT n=1 Tax=Paenibacillus sp. LjRoot153 TaxID=3342270 RepID=UPI003ECD0485
MEKLLKFNQEQLNMIKHIVALEKGTEMELKLFVEYCENVGLNPIMRQIMFQKREAKLGPRWTPLTTRDGYLWKSRTSPDYVGAPLAGVVREGDEFAFDNVTGLVTHKFGAKRGNLLGAWAVMRHKRYDTISTFVEFKEYSEACINNPVWRSNPTAMIQKIAEVFVMRRQFPVDGLYTIEEFGVNADLDGFGEDADITTMLKPPVTAESVEPTVQPIKEIIEVSTTTSENENQNLTMQTEEKSEESATTSSTVQKPENPVQEQKEEEKVVSEQPIESSAIQVEPEAPVASQSEAAEHSAVVVPPNAELYTIKSRREGRTTSKAKFLYFSLVRSDGTNYTALARDEHVLNALELIPDNSSVMIATKSENGFNFIEFAFKVTQAA